MPVGLLVSTAVLCWCYYGVVDHLHGVWPLSREGWNKNAMLGNSVHDSFIKWTPGRHSGKLSPATEPGPKCSLCGAVTRYCSQWTFTFQLPQRAVSVLLLYFWANLMVSYWTSQCNAGLLLSYSRIKGVSFSSWILKGCYWHHQAGCLATAEVCNSYLSHGKEENQITSVYVWSK